MQQGGFQNAFAFVWTQPAEVTYAITVDESELFFHTQEEANNFTSLFVATSNADERIATQQ